MQLRRRLAAGAFRGLASCGSVFSVGRLEKPFSKVMKRKLSTWPLDAKSDGDLLAEDVARLNGDNYRMVGHVQSLYAKKLLQTATFDDISSSVQVENSGNAE